MKRTVYMAASLALLNAFWLLPFLAAHENPSGEDPNAAEVAKLQGVWINEFTEQSGERATPESRHIFVGNRYFRIDDGRVAEEGTFKVDATDTVKKIDFTCL